MSGLKPLLWKDLRLARGYLVAGAAVLVAPYLYMAITWARADAQVRAEWATNVQLAGVFAGVGAMMVVALLAGASFATERTDRASEFLAYLPLTRPSRLVSKMITVVGAALVLALCNPLLGARILPFDWLEAGPQRQEAMVTLLCSGVLVLGVAWLGSTGVSAAAALLLGLLSPFFVVCLYFLSVRGAEVFFGVEIDLDDWFPAVYRWSGGLVGAVAFALGSWVFLARGE